MPYTTIILNGWIDRPCVRQPHKMSTFLATVGSRLGDAVIALPVLQSLICQGKRTFLVCRSRAQEELGRAVPGMSGVVRERDLPAILSPTDDY